MKKHSKKISFSIGWIIVMALLIQSFHAFHHLEEVFHKTTCHHFSTSKHQITHSHEFEKCFTCEFVFSSVVFDLIKNTAVKIEIGLFKNKQIFFTAIISIFNGSLYSLRGPPFFSS
jgi:hypothetical protein